MKTKVVFRKFAEDDDVIALFPEIPHDDKFIQSYMRVGQHGPASHKLISQLAPADEWEYKPLMRELERIGYQLQIV